MGTTSFTQLNVWKKAHQVTLVIYRLTKKFPADERFGLSSQMRRAAVSIPANIAEGYGRRKPNDKVRFYTISEGSNQELLYYIILSKDLGYIDNPEDLLHALEEVARMLRGLCDSILKDGA